MRKENLQLVSQGYENHMRIVRRVICQQTGPPRRSGLISRNIQTSKTESGKNR